MDIKGKVAWINGGARIGATVAVELAKKGCDIAISYRRSRDSAELTARDVENAGARAYVVKANVANEKDAKAAVSKIKKTFGRLDVLVNMASIYEQSPFERLTTKTWEENIDSNLTAAFQSVRFAAPLLKKHAGRVVNFTDWVAASGRPRYKKFLPYYTAKSGILGLTQAQALELAPHVLVNAIAPGPILPPKKITNEEVRNVKQVTPLGRWGGPLEIAKAVLFLCETDFVTGECIRVDGGRHLY